MNIALIRKRFVFHGGAEQYLASLIRELLKQGHTLTLLANKWETQPNLHFIKIPTLKILSFFSLISFAFFSFIKIKIANKKNKFDLIHSFEKTCFQDIYRAGDGCHLEFLKKRWSYLSAAKKLSIIINPFHIATLLIEKIIFSNTKKIIAISAMGKQEIMTNYHVDANKIKIIYNGVDFEKFQPNQKTRAEFRTLHHLTDTDFVLFFAGSGFKRKGLDFLLNSLPLLNNTKVKLLVAGYDKNLTKYKKKVHHLQIENQVTFLNSSDKMTELFTACDLLVMPAVYEPFGNVALEALASGIPALISTNSGACELIKENINGLTITNINDPLEISEKIKKIIDNIAFLKQNSRNSIAEYTLEKNAGETINLYEELLNQ